MVMPVGLLGRRRAAAGVSLSIALCLAASTRAQDTLRDQVNAALDLSYSELRNIALPDIAGDEFSLTVDLGGETYVFDMVPYSMRAPGFRLLVGRDDGSLVEIPAGPPTTYRGTADGGLARVAASIDDRGMTAKILLSDGEWYIQPLSEATPNGDREAHVVYARGDVVPLGYECGTQIDADSWQDYRNPEGGPQAAGGGIKIAQLAFETDNALYVARGSDADAVRTDVENIMNNVDMSYDSQVAIRHELTTILVRDGVGPTPYANTANDPGLLLNRLESVWNTPPESSIERDVVHFFTGNFPNSPTIGLAALGVVCNLSRAYGMSFTRFSGSTSLRTDVTAHEIGHNWNAVHCDTGPGAGLPFPGCCSQPHYTMCSGTTGTPRNEFSPPIIDIITAFKNSRNCLSDPPPDTVLPLFDDFPSSLINTDIWSNDGATVDGQGAGEPSPPASLRMNGNDVFSSGIIDTTGLCGITVEYYWQRSGTLGISGSPEPGEDLLMEYRASDGSWVNPPGARHAGGGSDSAPYEFESFVLADDAVHSTFQIRFRILNAEASDNFFIDDVSVTAEADVVQIAEHPVDDFTCLGGSGSFSVVASGEPPFSYQWKLDGVIVPGETEDTLVIAEATAEDFGTYTVEVSNVCSTVESLTAAFVEIGAVEISGQPSGATVSLGASYTDFVTASNNPDFQWFHNGIAVPDATSFFIFIPEVTCADAGAYYCEMTNDCSVVTSDTVELVVDDDTCLNDTTPPTILHATGAPLQTSPFSGYIDPRRESSDGFTLNQGIQEITIIFSEPVSNIGLGGGLTADGFSLSETGGGDPPNIASIDATGLPVVKIFLDRPITLQEWTTIRASVQDFAENPIEDGGDLGAGVLESDRIDIGFLPGDVDQNGFVNPLDLFRFRQYVNGVATPDIGTLIDFIDTDRNGAVSPIDLFAYRQLIAGTGNATASWSAKSMNNTQP
jgi:Metallo-peptidase family M12/Dockerin type I domain